MVIVRGPLFSLEASGSLAQCITYQTINGIPVVKSLRFSTYIRTDAQDEVRNTFSWVVDMWINLHEEKKDQWRAYTNAKLLTGYKAFMDQFLRRTYLGIWQFELPPDKGYCITNNHLVDEFTVGGGLQSFTP